MADAPEAGPPMHTLSGRLAYALFIYESGPDRDRPAGFDYCPPQASPRSFKRDGDVLEPILKEWASSDVPMSRRGPNERRRLVEACADALRKVRLPGLPAGRSLASDEALLRLGLVAVHAAEFEWATVDLWEP